LRKRSPGFFRLGVWKEKSLAIRGIFFAWTGFDRAVYSSMFLLDFSPTVSLFLLCINLTEGVMGIDLMFAKRLVSDKDIEDFCSSEMHRNNIVCNFLNTSPEKTCDICPLYIFKIRLKDMGR
jgi:hypothetical protein